MRHLRFRDFMRPSEAFYFARTRVDSSKTVSEHTHDFDEIFLIEAGTGTHHINGKEIPLMPGALVRMRSRDGHGFSGSGMIIANTAFRRDVLRHMRERYFAGRPSFYGTGPMPEHITLGRVELQTLSARLDRLSARGRELWQLDSFLLDLFESLDRWSTRTGQAEHMPDWLADALAQFGKPEHFTEGAIALARLAGRSPEHVAREVRRWTGKTPTDVLNEARLAWAAGRLAAGHERIVDLALDCGFESLGHFYLLFKKRFGISPRKYRIDAARITGV